MSGREARSKKAVKKREQERERANLREVIEIVREKKAGLVNRVWLHWLHWIL